MKILITIILCTLALPVYALKKTQGTFDFTGFENRQPYRDNSDAIFEQLKGYQNLGKLEEDSEANHNLISFRISEIDQALAAHKSHKQKIPYRLKKKKYKNLHASQEINLTFPSQYKLLEMREHPRKQVQAKVFYSPLYSGKSNYIVLLPHVNDSLSKVKNIANTLVGASQGRIAVAVLIPPLYGQRGLPEDKLTVEYKNNKGQDEFYQAPKFIVPNQNATFHNMAQTLVDIHSLRLFLQQWKPVKGFSMKAAKGPMTLAGPSLGGIITMGYAGLVGGFDQYFSLVGGGNIPLFLDQLIQRKDVVLAIANSFDQAGWTFQDSVDAFLAWDPLIWSDRIAPNARVMMINACNDEFLQPANSILNLQRSFKQRGTRVIGRWNQWGHNPENASMLKLLTQFIHPLIRFAEGKAVGNHKYGKKCL